MAALAYVLLPISGMIAFFSFSKNPRVRFHGAQAVALGFVWPLALYGSSFLTAAVTQIAFVLGAATWVSMMVAAALGRDPRLPLIGDSCARATGLGVQD